MEVVDNGTAQRVMNRIFARYEKNKVDFAKLPGAEARYVAEKCPGFVADIDKEEQADANE